MIVVDTTVLVYAVGAEHPLRQPCRELVTAVRDGRLRATTTVEVIQEFAQVRARRRTRSDAADLAGDLAALLDPLLVVDAEDLDEGLALFARDDALGAFAAMLAATARRRGTVALVSADQAFAGVDGLPYVDPSSPDLLARLGESSD
jgi:hypothetical protein